MMRRSCCGRWEGELANVHLGTGRAVAAVRRDLARRKSRWLGQAARVMAEATVKEWKEWKKIENYDSW